jgi:AraC-like DNA-binding protein
MKVLLLLVCFQALNLIVFLFQGKKTPTSNFFLVLLFGAIFFHTLFKLGLSLISSEEVLFEKLHGGFSFLYGPILWFFVNAIQGKRSSALLIGLHLLPFAISFLFNLVLLFQLAFGQDIFAVLEGVEFYFILGIWLSSSYYSLRSLYSLVKVKGLPTFERLAGYWLTSLFTILSISIGWRLFFGDIFFLPFSMRELAYGIFLLLFFGILGLKYGLAWTSTPALVTTFADSVEKEVVKYKNYQLDELDLDQVCGLITQHFERVKPFKNPDYSLDALAQDLAVPKLKLTQALNLKLGKNFYQVINAARAAEARLLLQKEKAFDLLDIGLESGFKSKSTFYKYFKEEFGLSPGDFKRNQLPS